MSLDAVCLIYFLAKNVVSLLANFSLMYHLQSPKFCIKTLPVLFVSSFDILTNYP